MALENQKQPSLDPSPAAADEQTRKDQNPNRVKGLGSLPAWALPVAMVLLTIGLFGDVLFVGGRIPATADSDLRTQYLNWRDFAFSEIRHGHFPLWNPYSLGGTPFFGDPQSAMLYPPNWLNLVLEPARAACWLTAIHFFLAGWFCGLWCRSRGTSVAAAILAGAAYACCGPIVANLRAGHLALLCSAAWTPLLFRCVDGLFEEGRMRKWVLGGIPVVAMLALDGYPQFAYYTALAAGFYVLIRLVGAGTAVQGFRWRALVALAIMFAGGWAIAGAQIMASAQFASESIRAGGLSYHDAAMYSLPPENLLTLVVPGYLGDEAHLPYYGRWYWWEGCVYVGPAILLLAAYGAFKGKWRWARVSIVMVGLMMLLALGSSTPMFWVLYHAFPAFGNFRAATRFSLIGLLFLILLAVQGWDRLRSNSPARSELSAGRGAVIVGGLVVAVGLAVACWWAATTESAEGGGFSSIIAKLEASEQSVALFGKPINPTFPAKAAVFAAEQFGKAALATAMALALFWGAASRRLGRSGWLAVGLGVLAVGQLIWFAAGQRVNYELDDALPVQWKQSISALPEGERVFIGGSYAEAGFSERFLNATGYNPLRLWRTSRFLAAVLGWDPNEVSQNYPIRGISPAFRILRCGTFFSNGVTSPPIKREGLLPRLFLVGEIRRVKDDDAALAAVLEKGFDPAKEVVLRETDPVPNMLQFGPPFPRDYIGQVRLIGETMKEMEIEADVPTPQVLLVTDAYSDGWKVEPMEGGKQQYGYQVMPADYCICAIPLGTGHHHFKLVYRPTAVVVGASVSTGSLVGYLAIVVWSVVPSIRKRLTISPEMKN